MASRLVQVNIAHHTQLINKSVSERECFGYKLSQIFHYCSMCILLFFKIFGYPKFFVIKLKFDHKVMPSKDTDENANSFKPDQTVSLSAV